MSLYSELQRRNVLRVAAVYVAISWLLIQVIGELFPLFGGSDAAARYVVIALAVGFVPTVIVAWAFEWTPQGLKRDSDIEPSQSIAQQTGKTLDRIIMVVLALALGYFAFDKFVLDPARDVEIAAEAAEQARQAFEAYIRPMGPASDNFPYELESSALVFYALGQQKEFEATRQELVDTWSDREPMLVARLLAWTGDADAVFEYMDRELDPTAINFKYNFSSFMWNPLLQKLRDDSRFLAWRKKAGMSKQRLATFELDIPQ